MAKRPAKKTASPSPAARPTDPLTPEPRPAAPPAAPPPANVSTQPHSQVVEPAAHPWLTHTLTYSSARSAPSTLDQEWLLTNGTGAYAMGTAPGAHTRRYHGLLVACTHPPVGRVVALHQVLEQLVLTRTTATGAPAGEQVLDLSALLFRDDQGQPLYVPHGVELLRSFQKGLMTRWVYSWGPLHITRELYLHWKDQAVTLRYRIDGLPTDGTTQARLRLSPMVSLRDFHALTHRGQGLPLRCDARPDRVTIHRGDLALTCTCGQGSRPARWTATPDLWWYNIYYPADAERGQDCQEDYPVPGTFEITIDPASTTDTSGGGDVTLAVALGVRPADPQGWTIDERAERLESALPLLSFTKLEPAPAQTLAALADPVLPRVLAQAADDFLVDRLHKGQSYTTVMAGYPWFADWGRDTFIALSGLTLATGRYDEARSCLQLYAQAVRDGLVPNRFDDYDDAAAHYNTVDSSLWFLRAAIEYINTTGDRDLWHDALAPVCLQIMDAFIRGTQYGIRVGGDGLVMAGNPTTQLTWMDAACGGVVFTPRPGKCVEINTLWFYALNALAELIRVSPEIDSRVADHYLKLADRMKRSFLKVFWDEGRSCLRDHVYVDEQGNEYVDAALRPNQIFALSLPISPLPRTRQLQVLDTVRRRLLTPAGLRTLPEDDPHYHPWYGGPQFQRDEAYHQGTIWPWLMGPYCEAVLRVGDFCADARHEVLRLAGPLLNDMLGPGLGQLHEIHEAAPSHNPRHPLSHRGVGCPAQAWSVGELIRVLRLMETV